MGASRAERTSEICGVSSASGVGSREESGSCGIAETRFPQRALASTFPSVISVSPLCMVTGLLVQKISWPIR